MFGPHAMLTYDIHILERLTCIYISHVLVKQGSMDIEVNEWPNWTMKAITMSADLLKVAKCTSTI